MKFRVLPVDVWDSSFLQTVMAENSRVRDQPCGARHTDNDCCERCHPLTPPSTPHIYVVMDGMPVSPSEALGVEKPSPHFYHEPKDEWCTDAIDRWRKSHEDR